MQLQPQCSATFSCHAVGRLTVSVCYQPHKKDEADPITSQVTQLFVLIAIGLGNVCEMGLIPGLRSSSKRLLSNYSCWGLHKFRRPPAPKMLIRRSSNRPGVIERATKETYDY